MIEPLSPFQTWVLFMTFDESETMLEESEILRQCCDSAIADLELGNISQELEQLITSRYLYYNRGYGITSNGVLYVRKLLLDINKNIHALSKQQSLIAKQENEMTKQIGDGKIELKTFLRIGTENIGSIMALVRALSNSF